MTPTRTISAAVHHRIPPARRPVWGNGSDLWSPISDDMRVGDWLGFMCFDRHRQAMLDAARKAVSE